MCEPGVSVRSFNILFTLLVMLEHIFDCHVNNINIVVNPNKAENVATIGMINSLPGEVNILMNNAEF